MAQQQTTDKTCEKGIAEISLRNDRFRGIALLESMYKLISMIIHRQLKNAVKYHDFVHGF